MVTSGLQLSDKVISGKTNGNYYSLFSSFLFFFFHFFFRCNTGELLSFYDNHKGGRKKQSLRDYRLLILPGVL